MLTALYPDVRNPKQQQQIAAIAYFCCGQFA